MGDRCFAAVVCAAVAFCWVNHLSDPPWFQVLSEFTDEAQYSLNCQHYLKTGTWELTWQNNIWNSPLYQGVCLLGMSIFGTTLFAIRTVSAIFASGTILVIAFFWRRNFGWKISAAAVTLLSLNSGFYELRRATGPEMSALFFTTLGYCLLAEDGQVARLSAGVSLGAAVLCKITSVYWLGGALAYIAFTVWRRREKAFSAALFLIPVAAAAGCVGVIFLLGRGRWNTQLAVEASFFSAQQAWYQRFLLLLTGDSALCPGLILAWTGASSWFASLWAPRNGGAAPERRAEDAATFWALGILAVSLIWPTSMPRRIIGSIIPLSLLCVLGFHRMSVSLRCARTWRKAAFAVTMVLQAAFWGVAVSNCAAGFKHYIARSSAETGIRAGLLWACDPKALATLWWIACALFAVSALALRGKSESKSSIVNRLAVAVWMVAFGASAWFTVGWCAMNPSYTVLQSCRRVAGMFRAGDALVAHLHDGRQAFLLSLEGPAAPLMEAPRPEPWRGDVRLLKRARCATVMRRTLWKWSKAEGWVHPPKPEDIVNTLSLDVIPNPWGVCAYTFQIAFLSAESPQGAIPAQSAQENVK